MPILGFRCYRVMAALNQFCNASLRLHPVPVASGVRCESLQNRSGFVLEGFGKPEILVAQTRFAMLAQDDEEVQALCAVSE